MRIRRPGAVRRASRCDRPPRWRGGQSAQVVAETATSLASTPASGRASLLLADRSATGSGESRCRSAPTWTGSTFTPTDSPATRTSLEVVKSAYDVARRFALPSRHHGRRLAQHAVRGDSECRRVSRHAPLSRRDHRIENAADAEAYLARLQSPRSSSTASSAASGGARPARATGVPHRQGAGNCSFPRRTRSGGTLVESIEQRSKDIPGTGPSARERSPCRRSRRRSIGRSPNSGLSASLPQTMRGFRRGRTARFTGGRSRPRRPRPCRRTESTSWARAS